MDNLDLAIGNVVCKVGISKLEPARKILLRKIARAKVHIPIVVILLIGLGIELGIVDRQDGFARKRLIDMNLTVATDIGRIDTLRLGRSDLRVAGERHRTKGVNCTALLVLTAYVTTVEIIRGEHERIVDNRTVYGARRILCHRNGTRHVHLILNTPHIEHIRAGSIP